MASAFYQRWNRLRSRLTIKSECSFKIKKYEYLSKTSITSNDEAQSGWKERRAICSKVGISEWVATTSERNKKYKIVNAELPVTQSEIEDTDEETDEEDSSN